MKIVWSAIRGYLRMTDKWLLLFWLLASGLSMLFLWGIYNSGLISDPGTLQVQGAAIGLGLASAIVISLFDYRTLLKLWKLYVPICLVLVALTFFPAFGGHVRGDNQAWLLIPVGERTFSMQPSELLKISFITTMSLHLAKVKEDLYRLPTLLLVCLHGGAHVLLIQWQGDTGVALIYLAIFLTMVFCAGVRWRYIAAALVAMVAAAPVLWMWVLSEDQKMRILVLLNPELDEAYAWQQMRGISAIGYGGMQGTGIFSGRHIRVPEVHNDFIFSFIGESSGFIGCLGVIVLLAVICFKILHNSNRADDDQGRFLCIGVFAMIISQTVVNIGMCLSLLPVIGVTLPLFSQGGTSVLSMYLGLGLVLSVYCHPETSLFSEK